MRSVRLASLAGTILLGSFVATQAATPLRIDVMNWWTSGSETAALLTLEANVKAAGGDWHNVTIAGTDQAIAAAQSAAAGGNPPTAMQFNGGKQFDDLVDAGLLNSVDAVANADDWKAALPGAIVESILRSGHYYAVPVDDHGENWMYTSSAAFKKAGIEVPKTWDEFFPAMDKLKAAGITPIAWGGQDWQEIEAFYTVLVSKEGPALYNAVFRDKSIAAIKSPAFKDAVETFGKLRNYVDPGSQNRNWNDATAMLVNGTAGVQFMGDWAKGEFYKAKMVPGRDFGCFLGLGNNDHYFMISTDVLVMPRGPGADRAAGQTLLAKVAMSKEAQLEFNVAKGGIPARLDVDPSKLDSCARMAYDDMKIPANQISGPEMLISNDLMGSWMDLITRYWSSSSMTPDAFVEKFAAAVQSTAD